ncbi:unnamed protein product [Candida verbasci]|uniref:Phosphoribulokinase/uridine kinase domain-containing protein n=1 Tax=Candida verbasci TaxID=1227364 RepID=A0A9W4TUE7_9ASCO|nr:unnamed protein product [Candida verbasci]
MTSNIIILLGGGHASGKKTTALSLKHELGKTLTKKIEVLIIDMNEFKFDNFTKNSIDSSMFNSKSSAITINNNQNQFPKLIPSRFKFDELKSYIKCQEGGNQKILIVHGLYALYDKELRNMSHIKVFIDSDPDTRLIRWIRRDVLNEQIDTLEGVINAYLLGARSEMSDFIFPTKEFADVIMPRGAENNAINLIIDGIMSMSNLNEPMHLPENYLRPHEFGNFRSEVFDVQKNTFYDLN